MEVRRRERWAVAVVALTVALAGMATAFRAHAVEAGQAAPSVELPGSNGPVSLAQLQGKLVYLDFWASWCGPCRQSFPWMNDMQARYGERGLQVVAVNLDARRDDGEKFLAQVPASFAVAFDPTGETARRYALKGMPSSVLIAPDGRVVRVHEGFRPEQRQALEAAIVAALPPVR